MFVFSLHSCNAAEAAQSCDQDALHALLRQQVTAGAASSQVGAQMLDAYIGNAVLVTYCSNDITRLLAGLLHAKTL